MSAQVIYSSGDDFMPTFLHFGLYTYEVGQSWLWQSCNLYRILVCLPPWFATMSVFHMHLANCKYRSYKADLV